MGGQTVQTSATTDPLTYTEIRDFLRLDEGVDENILVTLNKMATQYIFFSMISQGQPSYLPTKQCLPHQFHQ